MMKEDEERIMEKLVFHDAHDDKVTFEKMKDSVEVVSYLEGGESSLMYFDKQHIKHIEWLLQTLAELED